MQVFRSTADRAAQMLISLLLALPCSSLALALPGRSSRTPSGPRAPHASLRLASPLQPAKAIAGHRLSQDVAPPQGAGGTGWSAAADPRLQAASRADTAKREVQREATRAVLRVFFGGDSREGGVGEGSEGGVGEGSDGGGGGSRATVVLPGGAGKTVLALRVAEAMHARGELRSALVLVPSLALVTQTIKEWQVGGLQLELRTVAVAGTPTLTSTLALALTVASSGGAASRPITCWRCARTQTAPRSPPALKRSSASSRRRRPTATRLR